MSVKYRQCRCAARTMSEMQSSSEGACEGGIQTYWPCWARSEGQPILFLCGQSFVYPELGANSPISFEWTLIFFHIWAEPLTCQEKGTINILL